VRLHGREETGAAVCEQREWDRMQRESPGYQTLVRGGITNEAEAERLARTLSGFVPAPPAGSRGRLPR
jgi:hypothetical protein